MATADSYTAQTIVSTGGTENLPATNELPVDMHSKMFSAYPSLTPLTVILAKNAENPAFNYRVDWQEKKEMPTTMMVAQTESSASTTIYVVENGETLVQDTLLYNPRTNDLRYVSATPTTNTITVVISQGGTTSAVWNAGDVLHVLLPGVVENDNAVYRSASVADANVYNLQQLCRMNYSLTRTMAAMKTHFGGPGTKREELKQQKYREFRAKKEKTLIFSGRATGGTVPATRRQMGGLRHWLYDGTLYKDFGGIMTETGFRNFIGDYKDQNPEATNVNLLAAGNVLDIISDFGRDKVRLSPMSKTYGLDISTYKSRGITVNLIPMPMLDESDVTAGWGFLLDMERIMMKTLARDTFYGDALGVGQSERIHDLYRCQFSLILANESKHAMFVGALL